MTALNLRPVCPARRSFPSRRRRAVALALLLVGLPPFPALHAAPPETAVLTEEAFLGEVPVILGATRLSQPLSESPAAITVIDRDMIEASGAMTIPDVLRLVPGFQVGHIDGHRSTVAYHGVTDAYARRMQVLVDGRSVYTPAFGGVLWADLPLAIEDIERIEVIRGPNGVTYGANAFSAVINIVTRHASMDQGVFVKYTRGDIDTRRGLMRYGGTSGDLSYRMTLGYQEDSGFANRPDSKQVGLATFRGDYQATPKDALEIQFGYNAGPRGKGRVGNLYNPVREEEADSHFEQLRWRHTVNAGEETSLQFYHNYHRSHDTYIVSPYLFNEDLFDERFDLEWQHILTPRNNLRLVWGVEVRRDQVRGKGYFQNDHYISTDLNRLFANAEWRLAPDWIVNAGTMYEYNDITGGDVSPRLAINHHLTPNQTVRGSISRAYRTPSTFEYKSDYVVGTTTGTLVDQGYKSTEMLKPERITSYEIGYLGELPETRLSLDLKIYREEIRRLIGTPQDQSIPDLLGDGANTFRNDGRANTNGAEAQLRFQPTARTRFVFATAYAHQRGWYVSQISPVIKYTNTDSSTPVLKHSLLVIQRFPGNLEASGAYYKQTNMKFIGGNDTEGYKTLDLRLAHKFRHDGTRGEVSIVGQNLRADFYDFDRTIVFDKRYFFNLSLELR